MSTTLTKQQAEATDYVSNFIRFKVLAAFEAGKTSYIYDVLQVGAQCDFSLTDLLQAVRRWWPRYTVTLAAEEWVDGVQMSGIKIDWSS